MDNVNSPAHYKAGGIETIDYMKAKMTPDQFEGYLLGNVLKYTSRFQHKNGIEDLRKAQWYLNKLVSVKGIKTEQEDRTKEIEELQKENKQLKTLAHLMGDFLLKQ